MNVLLVSCVFNPEPVVSAQITYALATSLSDDKNTVIVFSPRASRPQGFIIPAPFNLRFIKSTLDEGFAHIIAPSIISPHSNIVGRFIESFSFGLISFIWILFNARRFDIVYVNSWPIFAQFGAVLASRLRGSKIIIHVMDIYPESFRIKSGYLYLIFRNLLMFVDILNLRLANSVIAISESMKVYLTATRSLFKNNVEVIYTFQEHSMNMCRLNKNKDNNKLTFLYLGNIGPVAGLERVLEDLAVIEIEIIIAGSGSEKEKLQELVKHRKFENIVFMDVPPGEVENIQNLADVCLLPLTPGSGKFSVPSKLSSYMLSSKPVLVLAEDSVDSARIVLDANCGWVCPYGNKDKIEEVVREIMGTSFDYRYRLGLNGKKYATTHFSKENNINKIKDIFYSI